MPMSTLQILLLIRPLLHVRLLEITSSYATNTAACHHIHHVRLLSSSALPFGALPYQNSLQHCSKSLPHKLFTAFTVHNIQPQCITFDHSAKP